VFGAKGVSRGRALFLASAYVLGMATLYTTLGVVVALTGGQRSARGSASPWSCCRSSACCSRSRPACSAPSICSCPERADAAQRRRRRRPGRRVRHGARQRLHLGPVHRAGAALAAGVHRQRLADGSGVFYGGSLLFTYALGMGSLFFAVALGASLFRPGPWMEYVKSFFGIALVVMALWFLRPAVARPCGAS
jgi:thiol:disulfide interchange protein DsbD